MTRTRSLGGGNPGCTLAVATILFVAVGLTSPLAVLAGDAGETREAVYTKDDKDGKEIIRFTFPVNGGAIRGVREWEIRTSPTKTATGISIGAITVGDKTIIEGTFAGGDGGAITGHFVDKKGKRTPFTGALYGSGQGTIKVGDGKPHPLRFPPFSGCNADLSVYGQKAREIIMDALLKAASKTLYERLVAGLEKSLSATLQTIQTWRVDPAQYKLATLTQGSRFGTKLPPDVLSKFQAAFEQSRLNADPPAGMMLRSTADNVVRAYKILEVAETASSGEYSDATKIAAIEAIGAYSNAAGIAIAIAEAAKADWDAFAERVHDQQFRKFYADFYFQGTKLPSEARGRMGQRERLRQFMAEAIERLDLGGSYGAPFRKMLVDFAYYRLERSMSLSDFDTVETKNGRLILKDKAAAMVLATLFQAYEEVYWKDLDAERTRRIALQQAREQGRLMGEVDFTLAKAAGGDFKAAWPDPKLYQSVVCNVVADLQKRGLLKEGK